MKWPHITASLLPALVALALTGCAGANLEKMSAMEAAGIAGAPESLVDTKFIDEDGDGKVDFVDVDKDGKGDIPISDFDEDGVPDSVKVGDEDVNLVDSDNDDVADGLDINDDEKPDYDLVDTNDDNVPDTPAVIDTSDDEDHDGKCDKKNGGHASSHNDDEATTCKTLELPDDVNDHESCKSHNKKVAFCHFPPGQKGAKKIQQCIGASGAAHKSGKLGFIGSCGEDDRVKSFCKSKGW